MNLSLLLYGLCFGISLIYIPQTLQAEEANMEDIIQSYKNYLCDFDNSKDSLHYHKTLCYLYLDTIKNIDSATVYCLPLLSLLEKSGNQEDSIQVFRYLSQLYQQKENYTLAYTYLFKVDSIQQLKTIARKNESLYTEENIMYKKTEKQLTIAILFIFVSIIIVILFFLILLIYRIRQLKKEQKILKHHKREMNHRIKNNLQGLADLLTDQLDYIQSEKAKTALKDAKGRIYVMAAIHDQLINHTQTTQFIALKPYLTILLHRLKNSCLYKNTLVLNITIAPIEVHSETATEIGLLVNELVTNACRHAFIKQKESFYPPKLDITMAINKSNYIYLMVKDNGLGWEPTKHASSSCGLTIIQDCVADLDGRYQFTKQEGTKCEVWFSL